MFSHMPFVLSKIARVKHCDGNRHILPLSTKPRSGKVAILGGK